MSHHGHRRRRRTSGFDLVRLYEDDYHVLDECLHEKRHLMAGWAVLFTAGIFGVLLLLLTMGGQLWTNGEPLRFGEGWTSEPPFRAAQLTYPPDSTVEELSDPDSSLVAILLLGAAVLVAGLHLSSGKGDAEGEAHSEPVGFQPSPPTASAPSAFQRRLDDLVCIKISRRPQTHRHRH